MNMEMKFCQSCGMPLTEDVLGTNGRSSESHPSLLEDGRVVTDEGEANADGTKNEDYCMYCYKDGQFLQDCTMEEMIEHCAQFFAEQSGKAERVNAVNEGLEKPITKEEYIGMMKSYFPQLKRWRKTLDVSNDEAMNAKAAIKREESELVSIPECEQARPKVNPALAGVKELIAQMADKLPIAYISSVDQEGFPWTKASIYFCDAKGFKGMMLRGTMEVLTDAKSKEMIWHNGDEQYYPGGVTDPNYCVLKFTATDGRFYSDFYPRSFVIE